MDEAIYKEIKNWFLRELEFLKSRFYDIADTVAKKHDVPMGTVLFLFENSNLWPSNLSPSLRRSLQLMQEIFLWSEVPDGGRSGIEDLKKIPSIILTLAMKVWAELIPDLELRYEARVKREAQKRSTSFLDVMNSFERFLTKDRFVKREILIGLVNQFS